MCVGVGVCVGVCEEGFTYVSVGRMALICKCILGKRKDCDMYKYYWKVGDMGG